MKLIVHVPLSYDREYTEDFDENTLPNIGDIYEDLFIVDKKEINGDVCELTVNRTDKWYKRYEELYEKGN